MKTVVILGATSAVAIAYMRLLCQSNSQKFVLVGRRQDRLEQVRSDLLARGASVASYCVADELGDPSKIRIIFDQIASKIDAIDEVLLAYGTLGDQLEMQNDLSKVHSIFDVNLVSCAMWCEAFAKFFLRQSHGHLVVIGSVAGDRGRQSNYLYGATKSGLERISEGLAHRFAKEKNIHVTLVKPGFIDTPMTDHIEDKGGALWASPEKIAQIIDRAVKSKRVRVYAPWIWRYILLIVRGLPTFIMHRTKM